MFLLAEMVKPMRIRGIGEYQYIKKVIQQLNIWERLSSDPPSNHLSGVKCSEGLMLYTTV